MGGHIYAVCFGGFEFYPEGQAFRTHMNIGNAPAEPVFNPGGVPAFRHLFPQVVPE